MMAGGRQQHGAEGRRQGSEAGKATAIPIATTAACFIWNSRMHADLRAVSERALMGWGIPENGLVLFLIHAAGREAAR